MTWWEEIFKNAPWFPAIHVFTAFPSDKSQG